MNTIKNWRREAQREYKVLTNESIDDKALIWSIRSTWNHLDASTLDELLKTETYKNNAMTYEMFSLLEQETGTPKPTKESINQFLKQIEDKYLNN